MTEDIPLARPSTPLVPPFVTAMIIPTGVGASIGGFAGDATSYMRLLASVSDVLMTHPNVANAAMFQQLPENALYVEGYGLDQFFRGHWAIRPVRKNRIGVLLDSGMSSPQEIIHLNTIGAVQTVYGLDICAIEWTDIPVETAYGLSPNGTSWGQVSAADTLLKGAQRLVAQGAEAIALVVNLSEESEEATAYAQGEGVDPIGGIEAILSHYLVSQLKIPVAHAPTFSGEGGEIETEILVDPRAAAEYITPTFLPCVLQGLARAPRFEAVGSGGLDVTQLSALVVPGDALGGVAVLSCLRRDIPVIAVAENTTVCAVSDSLWGHTPNLVRVNTYLEACGYLQALREGIQLPSPQEAFRRLADCQRQPQRCVSAGHHSPTG